MSGETLLGFIKDKKRAIAVVIGVLGILLLFFSETAGKTDSGKTSQTPSKSSQELTAELEKRLAELISAIDGAGSAKVMITLDTTGAEVYAEDVDTETAADERTTEYSESRKTVLTDGTGLRLRSEEPTIRGVAVVCRGAGNSTVKREITETVRAALGVSREKIYVAEMSSAKVK